MHSGGGQKLDWAEIFIEADEPTARKYFEKRFGRDADNVTCECCGQDYSVSEAEGLDQITAFGRGCGYDYSTHLYTEIDSSTTLEEFEKREDVLIIRKGDMK